MLMMSRCRGTDCLDDGVSGLALCRHFMGAGRAATDEEKGGGPFPRGYRWPKEQRGLTGASMPVKCVIRGLTEVPISSANLTSAALDRNMERGLVFDGGDTARIVEQHYDDLIKSRCNVPLAGG